MYKFDVPLKLTSFAKGLPDEFVDKLINVAIAHTNSAQASRRVKLLFDVACRSEFQVKGFRSVSAATVPTLVKKPLVDSIKRSESIVWATLNVWLEARHEMSLVCQEFLSKRGLPIIDFLDLKYGFNYAVVESQMECLVEELHILVPKADREELRLMLSLLQGHVPMSVDEINDYPGVDINGTGVPATTPSNGKSKALSFQEDLQQVTLPEEPVEVVMTRSDVHTEVSPAKNVEKFRDTTTALNSLGGKLHKARELLTNGNLEQLDHWVVEFKQSMEDALIVWEKDRDELNNYIEAAISGIENTDLQGAEKEKFVAKVREFYLQSRDNPHLLQETRKAVDEVTQDVHKYVQLVRLEVDNLGKSRQSLEEAVIKAKEWQIGTEIWLSQSVTMDQAKKQSREDIARGVKINKELVKQIQNAVDESRRDLISRLLNESSDLIAQANDEQRQRIESAHERVSLADSRQELLSLEKIISEISDEISSAQAKPDVVEAAQMYLNDPDVVYLDVLLDALARNRRHGDVYMLLTTLFVKGMWQSGTKLDKTIVDSYFAGFQDHTSVHKLFSHLIILLKGTQLVYQVKIDDPGTGLGLSILYLSAMAVRPGCLDPNDLWQIHADSIKTLSPLWGRLLDQALQGNLPVIRDSHTLPAEELKQVVAYLDADFTKENGRYARTRGRNSIIMTNMEQQYLLPLLEEKWQKLKKASVEGDAWEQMKRWLSETDSEALFESVCRNANVAPNESPFYRLNFEERIQKDLQYFEKYITLKEEVEGFRNANFVLIEDALDALQRAGRELSPVYIELARSVLSHIGSDIHFDLNDEPALLSILEKSLLESPYYWNNMPRAVVFAGHYDSFSTEGNDLVRTMVSSFAQSLPEQELPGFYLEKNLPHIAEHFSSDPTMQRRASELKQKNREQLQSRLTELKRWKQSLSSQEDEWLASQRWNLLFATIDARLEGIRSQDAILAEQRREKYAQLISSVNQLEIPIMQASFIPPASRDELHLALDEIKTVCRKGYGHCIELAENLLLEVQHILDYKDAHLEGVLRVHAELKDAIDNKRQRKEVEPSSLTIGRYIDALRRAEYETVGVDQSLYSESMIEDRIDLLKLWESIKGLPVGILQSEADFQDMRHFFSLFAKIVQVQYGTAIAGKSSPYLFRTPVVHFASSLIKPGTDALRREIIFLALTDRVDPRLLKELDRIMIEEEWIVREKFVIWLVLDHPEIAHNWVRRKYNNKPIVVIDETTLLKILFSGENPTSTGYFKRMLLRTVDPHSVSVFWYENWVDNDKSIFVGREDWIRSIMESGQSHAIYGGRRIGKSSLLKAIEGELNRSGVTAIYIDLEGARSLKEGITAAQDILTRLEIHEPCESFTDFHTLLTKHFQKNPEHKVVILFDELDPYIRERRKNKEPHTLIDTCRNMFSEYRSNIRFVMAGFIELSKQLRGDGDISGQQNPYKNFLHDRGPLAALRSSEAQRIVKQGFQDTLGFNIADPSIPRRIVEATTGHPAFVQKFCERLFNRLHGLGADVTEVQLRDVDLVRDESDPLSFTSFVVETLGLNLNKLSQIVVYLLAANNIEEFSVDSIYSILNEYDVSSLVKEKIHESVQELLITEVFSTAAAQGVYKFSVPSYAKLLRQYEVADKDYILNLIQKYNQPEQA
jgi:hypothetical protein